MSSAFLLIVYTRRTKIATDLAINIIKFLQINAQNKMRLTSPQKPTNRREAISDFGKAYIENRPLALPILYDTRKWPIFNLLGLPL